MDLENKPAQRVPLYLKVEYKKSYAREDSDGVLRNISLTGAFLQQTNSALSAGEKIGLKVSVGSQNRLIQAQVIWSNKSGSGVKFLPSNNRDSQIIDDLIYFVESKRSSHRSVLDNIFKKVA